MKKRKQTCFAKALRELRITMHVFNTSSHVNIIILADNSVQKRILKVYGGHYLTIVEKQADRIGFDFQMLKYIFSCPPRF